VGNPARFDGYTGGGGKESIGGLLSIGDLGHLDASGRLFLDGRDDEMIVSGGENVYPAEVEAVAARLDAVANCAVVGVADARWGEVCVAYVQLREGASLTRDELRAHLEAHLARYKVPKYLEFVAELPHNATGKIRRVELRHRAADQHPIEQAASRLEGTS
jgi:fatty-acyl-CoA synthase